jgi:hypothetical protein
VQERVVREIRLLREMWRALETGSSLKIYAPALDPTDPAIKHCGVFDDLSLFDDPVPYHWYFRATSLVPISR